MSRRSIASARLWCFFAAAGSAAVAFEPGVAEANESKPLRRVVLEAESCPDVSTQAIRRIILVEIGDLLVGEGLPVPDGSDRLTISCADSLAKVVAVAARSGAQVERALRLDDFPEDAAPRALALAGIEVLSALSPAVRQRLQARQNSATSTVPQVTTTAEAANGLDGRGPALRVGLSGVWRTFLVDSGITAWGGKVDLERELGRWWRIGVDGEGALARRSMDLGRTSALLLSGGLFLGVAHHGRNVGASLSGGGRLGLARLSGDAIEKNTVEQSVVRRWGGPALAGHVYAGVADVRLTLAVEAGYVLGSTKGTTSDPTGGQKLALNIEGTWLVVSLGAALRVN